MPASPDALGGVEGIGRLPDPLTAFRTWYEEQASHVLSDAAAACCLSSIGLDGYPAARFVALKEVDDQGFIVTGPLESRKAAELERRPRAALTFWWPHVGRQVRVQGDAMPIPPELADRHFRERPRDAQLLAWASRQGQPLVSRGSIGDRVREVAAHFAGGPIPRPTTWGGHRIVPVRVEFLAFSADRLHDRLLFTRTDDGWTREPLQP